MFLEDRFKFNLMNAGQPAAPKLPYTPGGTGLTSGFSAGASGPHPGVETGYMPEGTMNPIPTQNPDGTYDVSIGMGGAPDIRSPWKKFMDGIDKDFVAAALSSLGDGKQARSSRGGSGSGSGSRGGVGSTVKPTDGLSPVLPGIEAQAPNPGFYTLLPRQQKDRYSGGF